MSARPLRLGYLVEQLLSPVPGGTGRFAAELGAALAATATGRDRVLGYCAWHRDTRPGGIPAVSGPTRLPLGRRALAAGWERGRGPGPAADVLLAPTLLAPPARRPLVVVIHDAVPWTHPETLTPRGVAFHRRMAARVAREAHAVLVPTAAVRDALAAWVPIPAGRVHVIGEGVSAGVLALPPDAAERARRLGLPVRYLLTVATLEPRKGLDVALDALALLPDSDVPLLLAGPPGWGGLDPLAEAARRGLPAGRVRLLGRLSDPDLAVVYAGAAALLAPSRSEGFGLPVLEAMAHGVPVVSSDVPALVEVGGGATRTVPVGDAPALAAAVAELLAGPGLREQLAAAGRSRAGAFSWQRTARLVWEVCRSAGGRPGRA